MLHVTKITSDAIAVIRIVDLKFCKSSIRLSCDSICDKLCKLWGRTLCSLSESSFLIHGIRGRNAK